MPVRPFLRRLGIAAVVLPALAVGLDLAVARWVIGPDGIYKGRPLPPWGAVHGLEPDTLERWIEAVAQAPSQHVFRAFDPELGWTNRPGAAEGLRFNSLGARGAREYGAAPAEGVLRVVCYGDSFTYGSEVGDADTWPARLEGDGVEAINLGVAAYGTDQALLRFRRRGTLGARVVVVGLLLENICRNVNRYRPLYEPMETTPSVKPRFTLAPDSRGERLVLVGIPFETELAFLRAVRDGSVLAQTSAHEYWRGDRPLVAGSAIFRALATRRAVARRRPDRLWRDREGEPYRVTLALLEAFSERVRAAGAERFVVLLFGTRADMVWLEERGRPYWTGLLKDLDAAGIECLDLASRLGDVWREPGVYLEHHFGPRGNALVAEALRGRLLE